jgi:hypothetical protein
VSLKLSAIKKSDEIENIEIKNKIQCPIFVHPNELKVGTNLLSGKAVFAEAICISVGLNVSLQMLSENQNAKDKIFKSKKKNYVDFDNEIKNSVRNYSNLSVHSAPRYVLIGLDERI